MWEKIRYKTTLRMLTLLLMLMPIATASAVYNHMYMTAAPISVESPKIRFVTGADSAAAGASIGTNGTYVVFNSIAGWPNATKIYEEAVGIQNLEASPHTIEIKFDSWSGDTTSIDYIYVKIFNATGHQQGSTIEVGVPDSSTGEITIPASATWRVQLEIKWQAGVLSSNTVSMALVVYTKSTAWKLYHHRALPVACETPKVVLQSGTAGTSTIYTNNTSAKVSVVAPRNWWNSSWLYRKQINITENSGNDLTNYAINFTMNTQELIANNKMNDDCSDIRFTGSSYIYELPVTINNSENPNELINYQAKINITDQSILSRISTDGRDIRLFSTQQSNPYSVENEIPFWIQSKAATELLLWPKVNVSGSSTKTLYMYYGNLSATTVSNGTEVFEFYDGFSADTMSDYTVVDFGVNSAPSSWSVTGGRMQETTNIHTHGAPAMDGTFAYHTSGDWSNYIFEAKVMTTDDDFIGLVFRYTNNSNYYRFAWERQDHTGSGSVGPGRYLHEIANGTWNTIDSDSVTYTVSQWYNFEIAMNESYIEAYIDGSLVLNGTGSGPASGKIGMYNWACQVAYWDDLRIRKLTSPEPTSSVGVENQIGSEDIELSYWIESGCNTTSTRIWVKIPSISSNGNVTIYMYHGNSGTGSKSDGKSTFYRYLNFSSAADGIDGGVSGQDGGGGLPTHYEVLDGGRTLHIWGNVWKYTILSTTVDGDGSQILEYNMNSTDNGELQGVGISNIISGADSSHTYKFTGSQSWGLTPDKTYSGAGGDWQTVYAMLNDFSGTYSYFIWMGDDDADGSQDCKFKDVRVREYTSPEPSTETGLEERNIEDYVDNNTSDADFSVDKGTHSNFSAQQAGPDSLFDILTEEDTLGSWGDYSSELLINPGAEFGNTTGWTAIGPNAANFAAGYDCPAGSAGPHTGSYAFYWNNPSSSSDWAYQEVDLSSWLLEIQSGEAQITAKGWLVCSEYHVPPWDIVRMRVVFYDNSSQEISSDTYDTGERGDLQVWTEFGIENYMIPTNAVKVRIWFQTFENNWDAGNADDFTVKVRTYNRNYELDLEVQWANATYDLPNEELCIFGGTMGSENIRVDVWNGTAWQNLFTELTSGWNNISVSSYLTSSNFTIRFKGDTETGDTTQDNWNIDATLLHVWTSGSTYDYVLQVINQVADNWTVNLQVYDSSNIARLPKATIGFHNGNSSDQIIVSGGNITQSEGALYDLAGSTTIYISMSNIQASTSGTSYLYVYLKILVPGTSTYNLFVITFEIT